MFLPRQLQRLNAGRHGHKNQVLAQKVKVQGVMPQTPSALERHGLPHIESQAAFVVGEALEFARDRNPRSQLQQNQTAMQHLEPMPALGAVDCPPPPEQFCGQMWCGGLGIRPYKGIGVHLGQKCNRLQKSCRPTLVGESRQF
jgi:hypothetical protein